MSCMYWYLLPYVYLYSSLNCTLIPTSNCLILFIVKWSYCVFSGHKLAWTPFSFNLNVISTWLFLFYYIKKIFSLGNYSNDNNFAYILIVLFQLFENVFCDCLCHCPKLKFIPGSFVAICGGYNFFSVEYFLKTVIPFLCCFLLEKCFHIIYSNHTFVLPQLLPDPPTSTPTQCHTFLSLSLTY